MIHLLLNALQQSLIFLPLTFAVYLSYEILKITDLTVEGSLVLGAGIFAKCIMLGYSQLIAIALALSAGFVVGIVVTVMQRVAKINSLLAGILAVFMLHSVNFAAMGQPNIGLLNYELLLSTLQALHPGLLWLALASVPVVLMVVISCILHSNFGLILRALGCNPRLLQQLGYSPTLYLALGLAISNMLAALCGVMIAQLNGYADVNMGVGMALTAIGAVVIGMQLLGHTVKSQKFSAISGFTACFCGTMIYFLIVHTFLRMGVNPIYLKLLLGLVLVAFLSSAQLHKTPRQAYVIAS